ncbi:MAG: DUF4214 domain-containing protein [Saccharofermentans sp.]|nr:DUF4214 domain-containing protein [Saccharofermentans sp.]
MNNYIRKVLAGLSAAIVLIPTITAPVVADSFVPNTNNAVVRFNSIDSSHGVGSFVSRLYYDALGRSPDTAGFNDWCARLAFGEITGAQAAEGFFFGAEYTARNTDDVSYINSLYRIFFDREPDATGLETWVGVLAGGTSRRDVMQGFINSAEWANLCISYHIYSGSSSLPTCMPASIDNETVFVNNMYGYFAPGTLNNDEVASLATNLALMNISARQLMYNLIFSDTYIATVKASTPGRTINNFYKAFYGREALPAEINAFCRIMGDGVDLDYLYSYFVSSDRFANNCATRGIMPGRNLDVQLSGVSDSEVQAFFNDACFLGNSVTAGFPAYFNSNGSGLLGNVQVFARVSYSFLNDQMERHGYMLQYDEEEMQAAEIVAAARAHKVFICMGTNDLVSTSADVVYTRYISYIDGIIARNPGVRIFIVSTTPRCNSDQTPGLTNANIDALNSMMRRYCDNNGYTYIDINTPLRNGTNELYTGYSSDNFVHMNNSGYAVWSSTVVEAVRQYLHSTRHYYRHPGGY